MRSTGLMKLRHQLMRKWRKLFFFVQKFSDKFS